jgi:hypothetical protein
LPNSRHLSHTDEMEGMEAEAEAHLTSPPPRYEHTQPFRSRDTYSLYSLNRYKSTNIDTGDRGDRGDDCRRASDDSRRAAICQSVVEKMIDLGMELKDVDLLPLGVAIPIRECLWACRSPHITTTLSPHTLLP